MWNNCTSPLILPQTAGICIIRAPIFLPLSTSGKLFPFLQYPSLKIPSEKDVQPTNNSL